MAATAYPTAVETAATIAPNRGTSARFKLTFTTTHAKVTSGIAAVFFEYHVPVAQTK